MAERVEIEVFAKDLASNVFDLLKKKMLDIGGVQGILAAGAVTMGAAVVTGLMKAKDAAFAYDQQVKDMMLSTGQSAEATSRLIQVADDAAISYDTLKTAMKFAVKNGIEPNIESMAKLSDEYLKLAPGVERGQFLMDKFGKSGLNMARFMELGSSALIKMNGAVEDGLVLTQQAIDTSEEYRKNVDQLTDSWTAFKVTIGNEVLPVLNDLLIYNNKQTAALEEAIRVNGNMGAEMNNLNAALIMERDALRDVDSARLNGLAGLYKTTDALDNATAATQAFAEQTIEDYNSIISLTQALGSASDEETAKIVYNLLLQKLGVDGLTDSEYQMAIAAGISLGVFSEKTAAQALAINALTNEVISGTVQVDSLGRAIKNLPDSKTITVTTIMISAAGATGAAYGGSGLATGGRRAAGGPVSAGVPYLVGEQGQEMFVPNQSGTIIPNNKMGSSNNISISINTPAIVGTTKDALLPILREGVRQLQSEGVIPQ